jgi:hypothetical protein
MESIQNVSAEELAKLFHHYRGALAADFECTNDDSGASEWEHTPQQERKLTIAAVRLALLELAATHAPTEEKRRYFAKPGEADWGC